MLCMPVWVFILSSMGVGIWWWIWGYKTGRLRRRDIQWNDMWLWDKSKIEVKKHDMTAYMEQALKEYREAQAKEANRGGDAMLCPRCQTEKEKIGYAVDPGISDPSAITGVLTGWVVKMVQLYGCPNCKIVCWE